MPAIVVDDITVLPRIPEPDPTVARQRPVAASPARRAASKARASRCGGRSPGSTWPTSIRSSTSTRWARWSTRPGEPKGTPWHPHRGFETVTYMIDGTFEHSDSNGGGGVITNGDTQWMTAGAGILHIEKPPEALVVSGGLFHGLQLWVNLPRDQKWTAPRYQDLRAGEVALVSSSDGGALVRVIAGDVAGHAGPGSTYTPMTMVHATLSPGARLSLPWRADYNALVYVLAGRGSVGAEGRPIETGQLAVFGPGNTITVSRLDRAGEPEPESRHHRPRRAPDPRAGGLDGSVRDEHPRRDHAGRRRLPGRPPGDDSGDPQRPHDPGRVAPRGSSRVAAAQGGP